MSIHWPRTPDRQSETTLHDGRTLAWSEWGPPSGRPVLFCTGAGMSGSLAFDPPRGVRLIAADRPGLGRSSAHPGKTFATWAADIEALGLTNPAAIGFSQGAPFALALAHAGIVQAVAIVAGQDELTHPVVRRQLPSDVAGFLETVNADPAAFATWFARVATADGMLERIIDGSGERDLAVYTDPRFSPHLRRALNEGFSQGPSGYIQDLINAMRPWPFAVEEIEAHVHLWYGALDTSTVHSPDFGATLAERLPNSIRTLDSGEGGSILWAQIDRILEALLG